MLCGSVECMSIADVCFRVRCHDLSLYKYVVSLVMAYSFTENLLAMDSSDDSDDSDNSSSNDQFPEKKVMMVPVADTLNHKAKNNAHLDFGTTHLSMVATRPIAKVRSRL